MQDKCSFSWCNENKFRISLQVAQVGSGNIQNRVIETQCVSDHPLNCAEPNTVLSQIISLAPC